MEKYTDRNTDIHIFFSVCKSYICYFKSLFGYKLVIESNWLLSKHDKAKVMTNTYFFPNCSRNLLLLKVLPNTLQVLSKWQGINKGNLGWRKSLSFLTLILLMRFLNSSWGSFQRQMVYSKSGLGKAKQHCKLHTQYLHVQLSVYKYIQIPGLSRGSKTWNEFFLCL